MLNRFIETREELVRRKEKALDLSKLLVNNLIPSLRLIKDIPYVVRTIRAIKNGNQVDLREFLTKVDEAYNQNVLVEGAENIPQNTGFIIAIPHMETFDTTGPNPLWFLTEMSKHLPPIPLHIITWGPFTEELEGQKLLDENAFRSKTIKAIGGHPIVPKNVQLNALSIRQSINEAQNGDMVLIAPEGKRGVDKNGNPMLLPGKPGVGKIALESRCPVLPITFWEDESKQRHLNFLNPIYTDNGRYDLLSVEEKEQAYQLVTNSVMMAMAHSLPEEYNKGIYE